MLLVEEHASNLNTNLQKKTRCPAKNKGCANPRQNKTKLPQSVHNPQNGPKAGHPAKTILLHKNSGFLQR